MTGAEGESLWTQVGNLGAAGVFIVFSLKYGTDLIKYVINRGMPPKEEHVHHRQTDEPCSRDVSESLIRIQEGQKEFRTETRAAHASTNGKIEKLVDIQLTTSEHLRTLVGIAGIGTQGLPRQQTIAPPQAQG